MAKPEITFTVDAEDMSRIIIIDLIESLPTGAYVQKMKEGWAVRWREGGHEWRTAKADLLRDCLTLAHKEMN